MKKYQDFKDRIIFFINQSELDIGIIYFIFKDILNEIELLYYKQLNQEKIFLTQLENQPNQEQQGEE